jgi:pimeloyl-ACP methyl ester carboxylesterase
LIAENVISQCFILSGFGLSDKPLIDYSAELWRDQTIQFIEDIIKKQSPSMPCIVAGNSLGGFTALYAASSSAAVEKNLIKGCILLNAAGRFRVQDAGKAADSSPEWLKAIKASIQRLVIALSFVVTKQPSRIEQVLKQVYPVDNSNVDSELVEVKYSFSSCYNVGTNILFFLH